MAQRLQTQLERQLTLLEGLAADADGPVDELAELRRTAQLARRTAENLSVLGGAQPAARTAGSRSLGVVVSEARSGVANTARVHVSDLPESAVLPRAVSGLTAALSELFIYAVGISPAVSDVTVTCRPGSGGGIALEVAIDAAIAAPGELEDLDQRLEDQPLIDDIVGGRVGLFVAAHLARRAGARLRVRGLRGALGTVVTADCPREVVDTSPFGTGSYPSVTGTGSFRIGAAPGDTGTGSFRTGTAPSDTGSFRREAPARGGAPAAAAYDPLFDELPRDRARATGSYPAVRPGGTGQFPAPRTSGTGSYPVVAGGYDQDETGELPLSTPLPQPGDDRDRGLPAGGELFAGSASGAGPAPDTRRTPGGYTGSAGRPRPTPRPTGDSLLDPLPQRPSGRPDPAWRPSPGPRTDEADGPGGSGTYRAGGGYQGSGYDGSGYEGNGHGGNGNGRDDAGYPEVPRQRESVWSDDDWGVTERVERTQRTGSFAARSSAASEIDALFGPLSESQRAGMADMGPSPIYDAVASGWFSDDVPADDSPEWEAGDSEWQEARQRAARPEPQPAATAAGLPRRRPGTQMVAPPRHGSPAAANVTTERAPDRVRQRLAVYQRGLERGRHRSGMEDEEQRYGTAGG